MKATLAPTPAKMAREMLAADRRAQKRRHRARRARPVHTPSRENSPRPALLAIGDRREARAATAKLAPSGRVSTSSASFPVHQARREAQSYFTPIESASKASTLCDLLLAAILWGLALLCVGLTLAIACGIALHLFGLE